MQLDQRKVGIVLNYSGEAVKMLTALLYVPVMLRLLGQSEFGLYQLVNSTISNLSLISMGLNSAYVRFYYRYKVQSDDDGIARLNGMFILIFCAMSLICMICGGIMIGNAEILFGDGLTELEISKAKVLMGILVFSMMLTFPNSVFNCYITAHERFIFQKSLIFLQNILNPCLGLPLLLLGFGSVSVVCVTAFLTLGVFISNILFCRKRLRMRFRFRGLELGLLKEMWIFTFFIFLNQVFDQINWSIDNFLLGRMVGTSVVAVYSIGGQIYQIYKRMATSISTVFVPQVNRIVAESDDNGILTDLMTRVARIQFLVLALILTGFLFFGQSFIRLWAGAGYEESYYIALLVMFPMTVDLLQNLGIEIQRAKNMHRARSVVYTLLAFSNIAISILLIPRWGAMGAAIGTAITQFFGVVLFMNWYYHKRIGLNMILFWKSIARFIPSVAAICLFGILLLQVVEITGWVSLIASIAVYTAVYAVIMWFWGLNLQEKQIILNLIYNLKK